MSLWNRTQVAPDAVEVEAPAPVNAGVAPTPSGPALPVRTPGAAPAITASAITGSALPIQQTQRVHQPEPVGSPRTGEAAVDDHPLTSTDLTYRYPKERASGVEAGLRHLRAGKTLPDMSDRDLGLVTVSSLTLYDAVCADLGAPTR